MKALVTGTSGFVGSAVARRLAADGHELRVLMRPTSDRSNVDGLDVDIATGDLSDPVSLKSAVSGCDAVFHVAADSRIWVPDGGASMYRANVDGTRDLVRFESRESGDEAMELTVHAPSRLDGQDRHLLVQSTTHRLVVHLRLLRGSVLKHRTGA